MVGSRPATVNWPPTQMVAASTWRISRNPPRASEREGTLPAACPPASTTARPSPVTTAAVTGRVYWSRPWRTLQAFDATHADTGDAAVLWTAATEFNLSSSPVVGADGMVYFMGDSYLYAVSPVGPGLPPAKSSWPMFRANARHTGRVGTGIPAE